MTVAAGNVHVPAVAPISCSDAPTYRNTTFLSSNRPRSWGESLLKMSQMNGETKNQKHDKDDFRVNYLWNDNDPPSRQIHLTWLKDSPWLGTSWIKFNDRKCNDIFTFDLSNLILPSFNTAYIYSNLLSFVSFSLALDRAPFAIFAVVVVQFSYLVSFSSFWASFSPHARSCSFKFCSHYAYIDGIFRTWTRKAFRYFCLSKNFI